MAGGKAKTTCVVIRALAGLAFEVDVKTSVAGQRIKPSTPVSNERI
jgi:hypothetical protein